MWHSRQPDTVLLTGLARADAFARDLAAGKPAAEIARSAGLSVRHLHRLAHLSGLSPRIRSAIIAGRQPDWLTLRHMIRTPLPLSWDDQERALGIT